MNRSPNLPPAAPRWSNSGYEAVTTRKLIQPAKFTDDGRQRGGDDGLIQRREQHHQQQGAEEQRIEGTAGWVATSDVITSLA